MSPWLESTSNFYRLAQDVCELVNVNPVPWEGISIQTDEIVAACHQNTLFELFRVIYESAAKQTGASYWLCKSMKNMLYAEGIEYEDLMKSIKEVGEVYDLEQ